ncbi:hypothetical protein [Bacillus smithii]|uniref:hypothetical protein n=1 Tax=Bacillus smithii TaxID=1479 RepID=UPI0022E6F9AB|nr:hypothetical protein [Bacillus smithii]
MSSYHYCEYCGKEIAWPKFNFCPHCGKRIVGPFNNDVDYYLSVTIPEDDNPNDHIRHPSYRYCYRCSWGVLSDSHQYCCMCGYKLDGGESVLAEKFVEIYEVPIYLGRFQYILDSDEFCLFSQEDVAWYGDTFNHRDQMYLKTSAKFGNMRLTSVSHINDGLPDEVFDIIAAGTLYLTNKQVILYDPGFSNIWTKLSASGDFPEQVKTIHLSDIRDIWGDSHRIYMETNVGEIQLGPSNRKYKGRKTPIVSEYSSFPTFYKMLSKLIALD